MGVVLGRTKTSRPTYYFVSHNSSHDTEYLCKY